MVKIKRLPRKFWLMGGVSAKHILPIVYKSFNEDEIAHRSGAVAFQAVLSIFPALLFLFSLIPYIPVANLDVYIMEFLSEAMPRNIYTDSEATIKDIVSHPKSSVLSIGFLLTFYASTSGMMELMNTFNQCHNFSETRGFFKRRGIAAGLTFAIAIALLVSSVVIIVGQLVLDEVNKLHWFKDHTLFLLQMLRYAAPLSVIYLAVSLIYYYGPSHKRRWRFLNPGSVVASTLCILLTQGFSIYLSNFASYNKLYGSIGTMIGFMLWVYLLCIILLLGFEFNVAIEVVQDKESKKLEITTTNALLHLKKAKV